MHPTVLFDDGSPGLSPLDDLRPVCELRTGVLTTLARATARLDVAWLIVPEHHRAIMIERLATANLKLPVNTLAALPSAVLLLNARAPLAWRLAMSVKLGQCVVNERGTLVAACVAPDAINRIIAGDRQGLSTLLAASSATPAAFTLDRPWHVKALRDAAIAEDLQHLVPRFEAQFGWSTLVHGALRQGTHPVAAHPDASVWPMSMFDTTNGPILIDQGATIRPGAVLIGPCAVLASATVLDHATIRAGTVIGPSCKVAGEVSGTIFQGHSNKSHDGFVGDSCIGEWVNLGAGTTTSNLLNTYAEVLAKATPDGKHERTGQQFLGAILGDHVKTAIATRLMTGCIVHTGAMLAEPGFIDGCIPRFAWCTSAGRQRYRLDKFLEVAQAAMARRSVTISPALRERLTTLHSEMNA